MEPIRSSFSLDVLQAELVKKCPSLSSSAKKIDLLHHGPESAEALPKMHKIDERLKIRKVCFAYLDKVCKNFDLGDFLTLQKTLPQIKNDIDPRAYRALVSKLNILINTCHYGSKFANLKVLNKLFPDRVPPFHHVDVLDFIGLLMRDEVFFQLLHHKDNLVDEKKKRIDYLFSNKFFFSDNTCDFIDIAERDNAFLVARGSGMMKSEVNKSVSFLPKYFDVKNQVVTCVASLFTTSNEMYPRPFACYLQRLVGELRPGDPIPVSGKMATHLNTATITATYGHGDGIAKGTVPVDRVYWLQSGDTIEIIAHKTHRIGPNEELKQDIIDNPTDIQDVCCISKDVLVQLREIYAKLVNYYPTPMEVDFVVVNSFVHLVGIHPFDKEKNKPNSSFVISLQHPGFQSEDDQFLKELMEIDVELEPTEKIVEHLRSRDPEVVRYAITTLLFRLQQFIRGPIKGASANLQEKIKTLAVQVLHLGRQAYNYAVDKNIKQQMVAANMIETRMRTALESRSVVEGKGFDLWARDVILEKQAIEELGDLAKYPYALKLHQVGKFILDEKVRKGWVEFVKDTFRLKKELLLKNVIGSLAKQGFLPIVMNSRFPELLQYHFSTEQLFRAMQIKGFTLRLDHLQKLYESIEHTEKAINTFLRSEEFNKMSYKQRQDRFVELSTPSFELQYRLAKQLNEASVASLVKEKQTLNEYLGKIKKMWNKRVKETAHSYEIDAIYISIEGAKIGSPTECLYDSITLSTLAKLIRENCKTLITVLTSQVCSLLPQILSSKVGPLVENLLQLPNAHLVYAKLNYPWVELQINYPMRNQSPIINLRYHMSNGKVELEFQCFGLDMFNWWTNVSTLAYVATSALKQVNFVKEKTPVSKGNRNHTFTWSFDLPLEGGRFVNNLSQILMRILYCCYGRGDDPQFDHLKKQSIFTLARECFKLTGKKIGLVDLLSELPDCILKTFINEKQWWINSMGVWCSHEAVFELLNSECIEYLKNNKKILTDKILLGMLTELLENDRKEINQKAKQSIEEQFPFEKMCALIDGACISFSEKEQGDFFHHKLPLYALIYPGLYTRYKPNIIQHFSKTDNLNFSKNDDYLLMCVHLSYWTREECFHFLDLLTREACTKEDLGIGQIVPFLRSPAMVAELKRCVIKNRAWISYLIGIKKEPYVRKSPFSASFPEQEEIKACFQNELSTFHELVGTCDAKTLFRCFSMGPSELMKSLERFLTKEGVEASRKRDKYYEEYFYADTLPSLYEAHPRWLNLYQRELLNLIQSSTLFQEGLSPKVAGLIADIIQHGDFRVKTQYYRQLLQNVRKYEYSDKVPMSFLYVLFSCKDRKMQNEMVTYLVQEDRWDLIMNGAWGHNKSNYRSSERESGIQLLRKQFTPERLQQQWEKEPGWFWQMPCVILGDSRLKGVAYQKIFGGGKQMFQSLLSHFDTCEEMKKEVNQEFLSHFSALQNDETEKYIEVLTEWEIIKLLKMLGDNETSHTLWCRFLPFLRDLPEKFPELPINFRKFHHPLPYERYEAMMAELGWQIPIEDE